MKTADGVEISIGMKVHSVWMLRRMRVVGMGTERSNAVWMLHGQQCRGDGCDHCESMEHAADLYADSELWRRARMRLAGILADERRRLIGHLTSAGADARLSGVIT